MDEEGLMMRRPDNVVDAADASSDGVPWTVYRSEPVNVEKGSVANNEACVEDGNLRDGDVSSDYVFDHSSVERAELYFKFVTEADEEMNDLKPTDTGLAVVQREDVNLIGDQRPILNRGYCVNTTDCDLGMLMKVVGKGRNCTRCGEYLKERPSSAERDERGYESAINHLKDYFSRQGRTDLTDSLVSLVNLDEADLLDAVAEYQNERDSSGLEAARIVLNARARYGLGTYEDVEAFENSSESVAEKAGELEAVVDETNVKDVGGLAVAAQVGRDVFGGLGKIAKGLGKFAAKSALYSVAGHLPGKWQEDLERKLGKDWYNAADASMTSAFLDIVPYVGLAIPPVSEFVSYIDASPKPSFGEFALAFGLFAGQLFPLLADSIIRFDYTTRETPKARGMFPLEWASKLGGSVQNYLTGARKRAGKQKNLE